MRCTGLQEAKTSCFKIFYCVLNARLCIKSSAFNELKQQINSGKG